MRDVRLHNRVLLLIAVVLLSAAVMMSTTVKAQQVVQLQAIVDPGQASVPLVAPGGAASMLLDPATGLFSWNLSWQSLSGLPGAAHFHGPAPIGVNTGIEIDIGATSGLTSPSVGSAFLTAAQEADLLAGLWYINIHTVANPGGEIRGQVFPIGLGAIADDDDGDSDSD